MYVCTPVTLKTADRFCQIDEVKSARLIHERGTIYKFGITINADTRPQDAILSKIKNQKFFNPYPVGYQEGEKVISEIFILYMVIYEGGNE